jgi:hypothetical protein
VLADWPNLLATRRVWIVDAFRSIPGVSSVAQGASPISPTATATLTKPIAMTVDGGVVDLRLARINNAGAEFPSTLGVPLVAGRGLAAADGAVDPVPVVITASLARRLWPGANPLGQTIGVSGRVGKLFVVGVAADFVFGSLVEPAAGVVVTAKNLDPGIHGRWVLRSSSPEAVAARVGQVVKQAVPDVAWVYVSTGQDVIAEDLGRQRLGAWFFSGFGLVALVLGVGGVFGLVAYLANSRQREFGLRMALGATSGDLMRGCVRVALVPVAAGLAGGLLLAAIVARLFSAVLLGSGVVDPLVYAAVSVLTIGGAMVAALGAAWRFRRLTPLDALRVT